MTAYTTHDTLINYSSPYKRIAFPMHAFHKKYIKTVPNRDF